MSLTINLPDGIEEDARNAYADVSASVAEAVAIDLYRSDAISIGRLALHVAVERVAIFEWLHERDISLNYDLKALEEDLASFKNEAGL
jgi:predicted HTH domain antitoxin